MVDAHESVGGSTKRGKPDPNVVIPPAVKRAAERSEELMKQQKQNPAPQLELQPQPQPQPVTPKSNVQVTNFDPKNPAPPEVAPVPKQQQQPEPQQPDMEHQFNSMKGRYEREQENTKRLSRQIADMQHLMASLHSAPPQPTPQNQGSDVKFTSSIAQPRYVTPEEVKEYGEELMDVVGRRAKEVYEPILAQLNQELAQVRQQVGGVRNTVTYDASVKMYENLAKEVPNWEQINGSAEFARWLDQPDPLTGQIRRNILNYSHRNNMTSSVIAAFKGFLTDQASLSPMNGAGAATGNGADVTPASNTPASTPQVDLKQFAAPGRAKAGQTQVPPEKPVYTAADIAQFYRDKTAGKFAGREAEADQLERALYEAGREGRVRR